jgi:hypothetical protein
LIHLVIVRLSTFKNSTSSFIVKFSLDKLPITSFYILIRHIVYLTVFKYKRLLVTETKRDFWRFYALTLHLIVGYSEA